MKRRTIQHDIKRLKLVDIDTGGGCTALARTWKQQNVHCLITDDAQIPRRRDQTVLVGFYNNDTGEQLGACVSVKGIKNIQELIV